jgi:hypothetical protein
MRLERSSPSRGDLVQTAPRFLEAVTPHFMQRTRISLELQQNLALEAAAPWP